MKELAGRVIIKKPEKSINDISEKYRRINVPEKGTPPSEKGGFKKPPRPNSWK